MSKFSVYKIINNINNKIYIGKTQGKAINRWRKHIRIANGGKEKYHNLFFTLHAAIVKYGVNNFSFEEIENFDNEAQAFEREMYWISLFRKSNILYNLTDGGEGPSGRKPSPESKLKMSEAQRGEKSWKAKLSEEDVKSIKQLLMLGKQTQKEIAKQFNVSHLMINLIYKEKYWWWVKVPGFSSSKKYSSRPTNSKLNEDQVREIKKLLSTTGMTQQEIADKFNVKRLTILSISNGKRWAHIV